MYKGFEVRQPSVVKSAKCMPDVISEEMSTDMYKGSEVAQALSVNYAMSCPAVS